ncbi:aspartate--tRNA ligase [bacterium]|nr:aspartate--tRNA ligase [bacterium]
MGYRTHTCGDLRASNRGETVQLCGWVQRSRDLGGMSFIDLRDRYGITQLAFNEGWDPQLLEQARSCGREFVLQIRGEVLLRDKANPQLPTGEIEVRVESLTVLNGSKVPPFTIETETDGGEELRMRYRYLDLRRAPLRDNLIHRHNVGRLVRNYLNDLGFLDIETPFLIKSTPEGARDFVVPSRIHQGEFYALPQSPQTFKQLLMVAGYDRYYQIVRCFRDEDLRADRQPEFSQVDCEMAFVEQEDILNTFEGLLRHLLKALHGQEHGVFPRMSYAEAMRTYGNDKPDIRFGMRFVELGDLARGKGFAAFDQSELIVGIKVDGAAEYSRKQLDALTDYVKRPQRGMTGLVWVKHALDGTLSASVGKFYDADDLRAWAEAFDSQPGDLMLILAGGENKTRKALSELRLHLGEELGLRNPAVFAPLWVLDFPLLEQDEESGRWHAMHHPFTSPKPEDLALLDTDPGAVRANAYDLVLNGNEIGGGSIRIYDRGIQKRMFSLLGFSEEEAQKQFGFLMDAFEYGAPPHGGIALGFDRLCAILGGAETIREFIAFPKNNAGRDVMIDAPATIAPEQWRELGLKPGVSTPA